MVYFGARPHNERCPLIKAALGDAAACRDAFAPLEFMCPLIKAALGDAAARTIFLKSRRSCPLIKAALGDAARMLDKKIGCIRRCPLIKAALGDAAGVDNSTPPLSSSSVH